MKPLDWIASLADRHGLVIRGGFPVRQDDEVPPVGDGNPARTLILFGNAGSSIWEAFSSSAEYADGQPDPLDRWSERIGTEMARSLSGRALFPFGGPPYRPFLRWAKKAEALHNSRLGMLIHPRYGLWHAYRFAIALPRDVEIDADGASDDICARCPDQPCVTACPVGAFDRDYDAKACYTHLVSDQGITCKTTCRARLSCPYASEFRYHPGHAEFHMDAYIRTMSRRF